MIFLKTIASLAIAGVGVLVLMHVDTLARGLQNIYVSNTTRIQEKKGWNSYIPSNNPEYWKTSTAWFLFKGGIISLGIAIIVAAYPIVFGAVVF